MKNPKVVMMGLGYIGLPTSALIASKNIKVHGVDVKKDVINIINKGKTHIIEPDLEGLVKYVVDNALLKAHDKPEKADVFLISVPTPFKGNNEPDISYVEQSIDAIIPYIEKNNLIIIESTSPIGTTEKMAELIFSKRSELKDNIYIAYCPERVLPGHILYELENNSRIIGGINEKSTEMAIKFYSLFVKGELFQTDSRTAEMCKLVENSYRDVNIAFANELSIICDKAGIDVYELVELASKHPRVNILKPGAGVGGHCIAVDPWFIVHDYKEESKIIKLARDINNYKTEWVIAKIELAAARYKEKTGSSPKIACMGLAYKADIDDLRESPALLITKTLIQKKYNVLPVEPNLESYTDIELIDFEKAFKDSDIIALLVPHKEFKTLNLKGDNVLDFCGLTKEK